MPVSDISKDSGLLGKEGRGRRKEKKGGEGD
jgi:hypothetical protein